MSMTHPARQDRDGLADALCVIAGRCSSELDREIIIKAAIALRATPQPTRDGAEGVCPHGNPLWACGTYCESAAPQKPAPDAVPDDFWLIEAPGQRYLVVQRLSMSDNFEWSQDHNRAIRFRSQEQADAVMMAVRQMDRQINGFDKGLFGFESSLGNAKAVEHGWLSAAPVPPASPTSLQKVQTTEPVPPADGVTGIEAAKLIEDYIRMRDSLDEDDCANIIHILHEAGVRFAATSPAVAIADRLYAAAPVRGDRSILADEYADYSAQFDQVRREMRVLILERNDPKLSSLYYRAVTLSEHEAARRTLLSIPAQPGAGERTPEQEEISKCWQQLEESGFPPEASGWPFQSIVGALPDAIDAALDCLIRQREDLLKEVRQLRQRQPPQSSSQGERR